MRTKRTFDKDEFDARLLPCPFCGSTKVKLAGMNYPYSPTFEYWRACCFNCGAESAAYSQNSRPNASKYHAIQRWNKRVEKKANQ